MLTEPQSSIVPLAPMSDSPAPPRPSLTQLRTVRLPHAALVRCDQGEEALPTAAPLCEAAQKQSVPAPLLAPRPAPLSPSPRDVTAAASP